MNHAGNRHASIDGFPHGMEVMFDEHVDDSRGAPPAPSIVGNR
jgi:hypothetical protein